VFAYEVDGFGNSIFMDDGNVPSLLSLPYIGYISNDDSLYLQTRKLVLSNITNPFYFSSGKFAGVGRWVCVFVVVLLFLLLLFVNCTIPFS
jgi:meiotically up-regulated gene 157 (Mug157) protein